jgi:hypothetical protein
LFLRRGEKMGISSLINPSDYLVMLPHEPPRIYLNISNIHFLAAPLFAVHFVQAGTIPSRKLYNI